VAVAETWRVEPSGPLRGDITVRGSKNAVTKHMVAAMLGDGPSVIRNAPEVGDVDITAAMLESVGYQVGRADGEITVAPGDVVAPSVPEAFTGPCTGRSQRMKSRRDPEIIQGDGSWDPRRPPPPRSYRPMCWPTAPARMPTISGATTRTPNQASAFPTLRPAERR
jgi:hypothetical protein